MYLSCIPIKKVFIRHIILSVLILYCICSAFFCQLVLEEPLFSRGFPSFVTLTLTSHQIQRTVCECCLLNSSEAWPINIKLIRLEHG